MHLQKINSLEDMALLKAAEAATTCRILISCAFQAFHLAFSVATVQFSHIQDLSIIN